MLERSQLIGWIRGEIVGPTNFLGEPAVAEFQERNFHDVISQRQGALGWIPPGQSELEEVLYFERETPHRKYGVGLLHPAQVPFVSPEVTAAEASDEIGDENREEEESVTDADVSMGEIEATQEFDDFEVTSPDIRQPSTIGVSLCVQLQTHGRIIVRLPKERRFGWHEEGVKPVFLNGRYELCSRHWADPSATSREAPIWRRRSAVGPQSKVEIEARDLKPGRVIRRDIPMAEECPISLTMELFPRLLDGNSNTWLLTVVLRNVTQNVGARDRECILYQTYFEVAPEGGRLAEYPESRRRFSDLDQEEQSLALLYREAATWGIGHGCAAGWDCEPGQAPELIYADVMPAVQLPSMTPDVTDSEGKPIKLSMRDLAFLAEDESGSGWESLTSMVKEYEKWMQVCSVRVDDLPIQYRDVARRHLDGCKSCLRRMESGIQLLRSDRMVRTAFKLANLAMLLQQIATKQLDARPLEWNFALDTVVPKGELLSPWSLFENNKEGGGVGSWRAFQIAFLLMSLEGVARDDAADREIVDLIWFPTGGGKTEAYLGVVAFYMLHERLRPVSQLARDGTNVLMRYTLRMLTTQQFQRAASLVCAMEYLRRFPDKHGLGHIAGARFSLGLWIGRDGAPNTIQEARTKVNAYRREDLEGNPLVIVECPWCRAEIGRYDGPKPKKVSETRWKAERTKGIFNHTQEGPLLHCTDGKCVFGGESWNSWLPIEIIDERIYRQRPSIVIATADKLAIIAYRPVAGALFGHEIVDNKPVATHFPPGLIIQDELHLISGPLGTMYALYEGVFERLCSRKNGNGWLKPKLVASTATIRGAEDQVRALYARTRTQLFPSPGLLMGDSFFGTYSRRNGKLSDGRLYLGIHANDYGSILTAQVRAFASALFRPFLFSEGKRDAWWSLLVFYNSIRELGGAKTLFDSDIRSRLKFLFNREGLSDRRRLEIVEELTSRLSQAEIVGMMKKLSVPYSGGVKTIDACLASNIIEVGVDIDRLSVMGVVGQPKTTSQYIQITGRVGRRWWERPGLILMLYSPSKSRDRSHFEQFHSYHRRLYERVEPTSATPFALSAIQRALPGALILWARQHCGAPVNQVTEYQPLLEQGLSLLRERCGEVQLQELDQKRSLQEMQRVYSDLLRKWASNPLEWEQYPHKLNGEYLLLWPGQFATQQQKDRGVTVPTSMRQVDRSAELIITQGYNLTSE